ncbi:MAG: DUF1800 family protein [Paludibaculum sp.]
MEFVASAVRAGEGNITFGFGLAQVVDRLGQPLYRKAEPTGYSNKSEEWVNSSGLVARLNFASALAANRVPGIQVDSAKVQRRRRRLGFAGVSETLKGARAMATRRVFLKNSALALFGVGAAPQWLARAAAGPERKKIIVAVLQRGAADGLNIVVPHGDKRYSELRPTIGIARERVIDLDGFFGLHPQLEPLKPLYDSKQLAIVQATGSPDSTRSHFDAQDYMESGTPGLKSTSDGWMNRALVRETNPSPLRAVSASGESWRRRCEARSRQLPSAT